MYPKRLVSYQNTYKHTRHTQEVDRYVTQKLERVCPLQEVGFGKKILKLSRCAH